MIPGTAKLSFAKQETGKVVAGDTQIFRSAKVKLRKGAKVSSADKRVYEYIKKKAQKLNTGKASSTTITIPLSVLGLNKPFTRAQFKKLKASYSSKTHYLKISKTNFFKIFTYKGINDSNIFLMFYLNDPLEFSWIKYYGSNFEYYIEQSKNYKLKVKKTKKGYLLYNSKKALPLEIEPSALYGSNGKLSTSGRRRIQKAIANAQAIINQNAGYDDLTKLRNYKKAICDLTSYDDYYETEYNAGYYDDASMISVFDGNDATGTICQGYARAFKYLCDHTTFSDPNIKCYSVIGMMRGSDDDWGGHMWNMIHMSDGKNYVCDVTNSDTGNDDVGIFLNGATLTDSTGMSYKTNFRNTTQTVTLYYRYFNIKPYYTNKSVLVPTTEDYAIPTETAPTTENPDQSSTMGNDNFVFNF
jgi:hypothetical protein